MIKKTPSEKLGVFLRNYGMSNFYEYCKQRQLQEAMTGRLLGHAVAPLALGTASLAGMDALASGVGVEPNNAMGAVPGLFAGGVVGTLANLPNIFSNLEDKAIDWVKGIFRKPIKQEDPDYVRKTELMLNYKDTASVYQKALGELKKQSMFMSSLFEKLERINKDPKATDKDNKKDLLIRLGLSREDYFQDKQIMDKFMSNLDKAISSGTKMGEQVPAYKEAVKNLEMVRSAINHRLQQLNVPKPEEPEIDLKDEPEHISKQDNPKTLVVTDSLKGKSAEETINALMNQYGMSRMSATNFYHNNLPELQTTGQQYSDIHFKPSDNKKWDKIYKEGLVKAMARNHESREKIIGLLATRWNMKESNAKAFVKRILGSDYF